MKVEGEAQEGASGQSGGKAEGAWQGQSKEKSACQSLTSEVKVEEGACQSGLLEVKAKEHEDDAVVEPEPKRLRGQRGGVQRILKKQHRLQDFQVETILKKFWLEEGCNDEPSSVGSSGSSGCRSLIVVGVSESCRCP